MKSSSKVSQIFYFQEERSGDEPKWASHFRNSRQAVIQLNEKFNQRARKGIFTVIYFFLDTLKLQIA